jgi:hypothetical protein
MNDLKFLVSGIREFEHAVDEAQKKKLTFMRSELKRGGVRIRREFIRRDLSGPPGIKGGGFKKGKQVFSSVTGEAKDLGVRVGISRALRIHEEGFTFRPVKGVWLFIRTGTRGKKQIVARAKQIFIPKRTNFRGVVKEQAPAVLEKVAAAGVRAVEVTIQRRMDRAIRNI